MSESPVPGQPVVTFAEVCDRGKVREENQDSVRNGRVALGQFLLVADGIGGYKGGAVASRMVVECFQQVLSGLPQDYAPDQAIRDACAHANATVVAQAALPDSPYKRMGSTVVMALIVQDANGIRAWIGHVGDSRAYLLRDGRLSRITNDHSAVQALLNRNLITPEEAQNHPDASVLTRSLGHHPEVEIDIEMVPLAVGDSLLLCSDGLWGFVPEAEIERAVADPGLTLEAAAQALLDLALNAGGHDNIGIELARVTLPPVVEAPAPPPSRSKGFLRLFSTFLLGLAVLGAATYLFVHHPHRLHALLHLH
jgi:protein phosphatase